MSSSSTPFFFTGFSIDNLNTEFIKFSLNLFNNSLLSRKAVEYCIEQVITLFSNAIIPYLQSQLAINLKSADASIEVFAKVIYVLESSKTIFNKFDTEHKLFEIYKEEYNYVPPVPTELGIKRVFKKNNENDSSDVVKKIVYGARVPLSETLQLVSKIPGFFNELIKYKNFVQNEKRFLVNFLQADLWTSKYQNKYSHTNNVFPIVLYFDEFESRSPLSSHAGKQSLGGVYISFIGAPPHMNGKSRGILVCELFHSKDLKSCGYKDVFEQSIDEINVVSKDGLLININGIEQRAYFPCVTLTGDNKAVNGMCGFTESFAANFYCRFCKCKKSLCQKLVCENTQLLRSTQNYEQDIALNNLAKTGIKEKCIFNNMLYFDVTENLSVDIAHDIYEGVAGFTLSKVIMEIIKNERSPLVVINNRIDNFLYNQVESRNKPQLLFLTPGKKGASKIKIKQSASELLCLTRYLGLMIGDLVSPELEAWKLYLYLRKIIGIISSPKIERGQIYILEELIQKHHTLYIKLFDHLKPKMHILTHYPRLISLLGPLVHFSTLKFERENKNLKEMAASTKSNINLPLTILKRHQLKFCFDVHFNPWDFNDCHLGPHYLLNLSDSEHREILKLYPRNNFYNVLKHVHILGKKYEKGTICASRIIETGIIFGIIQNIYVIDETIVIFHLQEYQTLFFNSHLYAYSVNTETDDYVFIKIDDFPKLPPCQLVQIKKQTLIACRYDF